MSDKLNDKQEMFCKEYLIDLNQVQAYIRAGYKPKTADANASRLMDKAKIKARIAELKNARANKLEITADWVLRELAKIFNADLADIIDPEKNTLKPIHQWPEVWRKLCPSIQIREEFTGYGEDRYKTGEVISITASDKAKWMKMIGDHVDVAAFAHNLKVSGQVELIDKVKRAEERLTTKRQSLVEKNIESLN